MLDDNPDTNVLPPRGAGKGLFAGQDTAPRLCGR